MKSANVILGVLVGAAAGGILGILFAPEKGSDTRKGILNRGEDLSDNLKSKLDDLLDMVMNRVSTAKGKGEDWVGNRKAKHNDTMESLKI